MKNDVFYQIDNTKTVQETLLEIFRQGFRVEASTIVLLGNDIKNIIGPVKFLCFTDHGIQEYSQSKKSMGINYIYLQIEIPGTHYRDKDHIKRTLHTVKNGNVNVSKLRRQYEKLKIIYDKAKEQDDTNKQNFKIKEDKLNEMRVNYNIKYENKAYISMSYNTFNLNLNDLSEAEVKNIMSFVHSLKARRLQKDA